MSAWAGVARCHIGVGDLTVGQAACDRAAALSSRLAGASPGCWICSRPNRIGASRSTTDGTKYSAIPSSEPDAGATAENQWAAASILRPGAYLFSRINQPEIALQRIDSLSAALECGAGWAKVYSGMACDAAATLWFLNRTDAIGIVEGKHRAEVIAPPTSGIQCAMAVFSRSAVRAAGPLRGSLAMVRQGPRGPRRAGLAGPLRAITDFDQAIMYHRRADEGDIERAAPFLQAACEQFRQLGMTGWIRCAETAAKAGTGS